MNIDHLRLQLDELEHRVDEHRDADARRRVATDCVSLERAVEAAEERVRAETALLEQLRKRLKRLRARA